MGYESSWRGEFHWKSSSQWSFTEHESSWRNFLGVGWGLLYTQRVFSQFLPYHPFALRVGVSHQMSQLPTNFADLCHLMSWEGHQKQVADRSRWIIRSSCRLISTRTGTSPTYFDSLFVILFSYHVQLALSGPLRHQVTPLGSFVLSPSKLNIDTVDDVY